MRALLLVLVALGIAGAGYLLLGMEATQDDAQFAESLTTDPEEPAGTADLVGRGGTVETAELLVAERPEGRYMIQGTVLGPDGMPVAGVPVAARFLSFVGSDRSAERAAWDETHATVSRRVKSLRDPIAADRAYAAKGTSGEDGTFTLDVKRRGSIRVLAHPASPTVASYATVTITNASPRPETTLRLGPGAHARGVVTNGAGTPVSVVLTATYSPKPGTAFRHSWTSKAIRADAEGHFDLGAAPLGELLFTATLPGKWAQAGIKATHAEGQPIKLVVGSGTAVVHGRVLAESDAPVSGAELVLDLAPHIADAGTLVVAARSGSDGRFRFEGLPGAFLSKVTVSAKGYVALRQTPPLAPWAPLDFEDGETHELALTLIRGGTLRGTVTDTDSGAPIADVAVGLNMTTAQVGDVRTSTLKTTTRSDGSYEIAGVPAGAYAIVASHATHYVPALVRAASPPKAEEATDADKRKKKRSGRYGIPELILVMPLEGGDQTRDFQVREGREISGVVLGPDGPAEGATITTASGLNSSIRSIAGVAPPPIVSDADGAFTLRALPPGSGYKFLASLDGFVSKPSEAATISASEATPTVELKLEVGATVGGQVKDEAGEVVPGAAVMFWSQRNNEGYQQQRRNQTTTKPDGTYEITGLAPGDYRHWAMPPGGGWKQGTGPKGLELGELRDKLDLVVAITESKASKSTQGRLTTKEGRPVRRVAVALRSTSSRRSFNAQTDGDGVFTILGMNFDERYKVQVQTTGTWSVADEDAGFQEGAVTALTFEAPEVLQLTGRVLTPDGTPVPMFTYALKSGAGTVTGNNQGPNPMNNFRRSRNRGRSSQGVNGLFTINVSGEGPWKILISKARDNHGQPLGLAQLTQEVTDPKLSPVDFQLTGGETLEGRVTDTRGRPVEGVTITTPENEAVTEADGTFSLGGVEGTVQISVAVPKGFVPTGSRKVKVGDGVIEIEIEEGAAIAGEVLDGGSSGVKGAWVRANWKKSAGVTQGNRQVRTDDQGKFRLEGIPSKATVTVTVTGSGGSAPFSLEGVLPGTENLEVRLQPGALVTGRVFLANGDPATSGYVQLQPKKGSQWSWGRLTGDGSFTVTNAPAGRYTLHVQVQGSNTQRKTFGEISAPADGLEYHMPVQLKLTGRIVTSAKGWGIRAWRDAGGNKQSIGGSVNKEGAFTITLPDGDGLWTVIATNTTQNELAILDGVSSTESNLKLSPSPGQTITGRLLDKDGSPLKRHRVRAKHTNLPYGWNSSVRTGQDGSFTMRGLADGDYIITPSNGGQSGGKFTPYEARAGESGIVMQAVPNG